MSDIVERLRAEATDNRRYEVNGTLAVEAADLITALRAENERLKTSGIAEVAAHNPSVMDYMRHWEGRTQKAEAENERLMAALLSIRDMGPMTVDDQRWRIARAALEEKS